MMSRNRSMTEFQTDKLVVGCGYLGHRVAKRWRADGDAVTVTTRSGERAGTLANRGFQPLVLDLQRPETLVDLPAANTVLVAVGLDRSSGDGYQQRYVQGLEHLLKALPARAETVIYTSTTGVYGQDDGAWVDEHSECRPRTPGGQAHLEAENLLRRHPRGGAWTILRMAGMYGPDRIPLARSLGTGEPIPAPPPGKMNLIHIDDAVQAVVAAAAARSVGQTFCVSDGHPADRREYLAYLANLLGGPAPRYTEAEPRSPQWARAASYKQVRNDRLLAELRIKLQYPSYREGLASVVSAQDAGGLQSRKTGTDDPSRNRRN